MTFNDLTKSYGQQLNSGTLRAGALAKGWVLLDIPTSMCTLEYTSPASFSSGPDIEWTI
jgi:hypothetical protein